MKKIAICFFMGLMVAALSLPMKGVAASSKKHTATDEKFDIMERDENEDSDTLAIPLDSSEVEDEEEINELTHENNFDLPSGHNHK